MCDGADEDCSRQAANALADTSTPLAFGEPPCAEVRNDKAFVSRTCEAVIRGAEGARRAGHGHSPDHVDGDREGGRIVRAHDQLAIRNTAISQEYVGTCLGCVICIRPVTHETGRKDDGPAS